MDSYLILMLGVIGVSILTVINPFYALPIFIFGHFIEPIQFFPELRQYNPSLLMAYAVLGASIIHVVLTGNFVAAKNRQVATVAFFIVWTIICTGVSAQGDWYSQANLVKNILPFFIFAYMIQTKKQMMVIIWTLLIMGAIAAIYGVYCLKANIGVRGQGLVRVTSFMANPNAYGQTLALLIPIAICLILSRYRKIVKIVIFIFIMLFIAGILISISRTSMIAMMTSLVLTPMLFYKGQKRVAALLVTLLVLPMLYFAFPHKKVKWRAHNRLVAAFQAESAAEVDLGRVESAKAGLVMMAEDPIFGVGLGAFGHEYMRIAESSMDIELVGSRYGERGLSAHNLYIQVGGQLGIVGLILYLYLVLLLYKNASKGEERFLERGDDALFTVSRALKIFVIVFMVIGITSSGLGSNLFWIFNGLSVAINRL